MDSSLIFQGYSSSLLITLNPVVLSSDEVLARESRKYMQAPRTSHLDMVKRILHCIQIFNPTEE